MLIIIYHALKSTERYISQSVTDLGFYIINYDHKAKKISKIVGLSNILKCEPCRHDKSWAFGVGVFGVYLEIG